MTDLRSLTDVLDRVAPLLTTTPEPEAALSVVTAACVAAVPGAESAAVTLMRTTHYRTVAATSDLATRVDAIQYGLKEGPAMDAAVGNNVVHADHLADDRRWPRFAARAVAETGVQSVLAFRLFLEPAEVGTMAGLNMYATSASAFDEDAHTIGLVLSTHAALVLTSAERRQRILNLERALSSSRTIGTAIGILMIRNLLTNDQAFDLLRVASQHSHRKLAEIAAQVVETGALDLH